MHNWAISKKIGVGGQKQYPGSVTSNDICLKVKILNFKMLKTVR